MMNASLLILLTIMQVITGYAMGHFCGTYVRENHISPWYLTALIPAIIIQALLFTKLRKMLMTKSEELADERD